MNEPKIHSGMIKISTQETADSSSFQVFYNQLPNMANFCYFFLQGCMQIPIIYSPEKNLATVANTFSILTPAFGETLTFCDADSTNMDVGLGSWPMIKSNTVLAEGLNSGPSTQPHHVAHNFL